MTNSVAIPFARWQRIWRWTKRILLGLLGLLVLASAAGAIYQRTATAADRVQFPPYGQLVQVGNHRLHLHCIGQGSPTIVVDNGAGSWSITWLDLQTRLAERTRTCTYDRAGLGWSDPGPSPRTSQQMVEELHTLLQNGQIPPPYILVGHSLGGYNVRLYAARFPDEVVGIALVESGHEEQWERLPEEISALVDEQMGLLNVARLLAHVGIVRLFMAPEAQSLPRQERQAHTAAMVTLKTLSATIAEFESARTSARQVAATDSLGDLPLVVVTARHSNNAFINIPTRIDVPFAEADRVWFTLQEELVNLSTNSKHFISETGTHDINFDDPDLVIEALDTLLSMAEHKN
ncbi:alpha/beta hydrolase [Chloroflexi bacterium TSY]|nr:alpha/beta hydrolase [Chloroflexi bacterium TSY]